MSYVLIRFIGGPLDGHEQSWAGGIKMAASVHLEHGWAELTYGYALTGNNQITATLEPGSADRWSAIVAGRLLIENSG